MTHLPVALGFLLVVAVFQVVLAQTNPEEEQLKKLFEVKCLENTGHSRTFDKLWSDVFETLKYFREAFRVLPDHRTFCKGHKSNLVYRAKEIEADLNQCLSSKEQFLGSFFEHSFGGFLHFFCHNDGEYTKRFFSRESLQCQKDIGESKSDDLDYCLNRIFAPSQKYISPIEICDDVTVARKCFTQLLDKYCSQYPDLKQLNGIFFNYISKPCSSCLNVINNYILISLVSFNLLIYFKQIIY